VTALKRLATMRDRAGDRAGAERLVRAAAGTGDLDSLLAKIGLNYIPPGQVNLTRVADPRLSTIAWLGNQGAPENAEGFARDAAAKGDGRILVRLATMHNQAGDLSGAERLLHMAVDAGDVWALIAVAAMREGAGDHCQAQRVRLFGLDAT